MPKYVIERSVPGAGSAPMESCCDIARRSCAAQEQLGPGIQWLESFVTQDKLYCVTYAPDEETIREHARLGGFPVDAVHEVKRMIDPTMAA